MPMSNIMQSVLNFNVQTLLAQFMDKISRSDEKSVNALSKNIKLYKNIKNLQISTCREIFVIFESNNLRYELITRIKTAQKEKDDTKLDVKVSNIDINLNSTPISIFR